MDTRTLNGHINAVRQTLQERGVTAGDAATVAAWTLIACGMDLLDNRHSDMLWRFVMATSETALKESVRANFRIDRRIALPGRG